MLISSSFQMDHAVPLTHILQDYPLSIYTTSYLSLAW